MKKCYTQLRPGSSPAGRRRPVRWALFHLFLFLLISPAVLAQSVRVSGRVSDQNGTALPGVSVTVSNTTTGTVTDGNGLYELNVPQNSILHFSSIGYIDQEQPLGNRTTVHVTLAEDTQDLEEVVVIGYGTVRKRDLTGAIASVSSEKIKERSYSNVLQSLSGQLPGVNITQNSGAPGMAPSIRVRGASSINSGTSPLYVVDGIPIEDATPAGNGEYGTKNLDYNMNPLNTINPNDIASVEVLKDAASAAIYGSRGANGVILITTKQGQAGKARLEASYEFGISEVTRKIDMMNAPEFMEWTRHYRENTWITNGRPANRPLAQQIPWMFDDAEWLERIGNGTDWQDVLFRTAYTHNAQFSVSGGTEKTQYMFSAGYLDSEGVVENTYYDRVNLRLNIRHQFTDRLALGATASYARTGSQMFGANGKSDAVSFALQSDPLFPVVNDVGTYSHRDPNSIWYEFQPYSFQLWHNQQQHLTMKRIKYTALLVALWIGMGSCGNDFLNLTPHSNANEEDFFRTQTEIETAMVAAYSSLHTIYGSLNVMYFFGALSSDDAYTDDQGTGAYDEFEIAQPKVNNSEVLNAWNQFYAAITRMNKIIGSAEALSFEEKESYIAEMKFLRALYYFNMTRIWGGVPLVTHIISISEAYAMGRASEAEMYAQIIEDLEYGIQYLPVIGSARATGTPTRGSAYALLGKVYLTRGNEGDKTLAATTLQNIYERYSLMPDYADLWDLKKKNGAESIFEVQFLGGASNAPSSYWALYTPANNVGAITLQGGGHNQVTDDLWNDYETDDPRRDISIQDGWTNLQGVFNPTRYPIKWVDRTESYVGKREASDNNYIVLRYADVLLMLTEATDDPKYLNEVRTRAGLPLYGTAGYPSAKYPTLALALEHERRVELAMEFHRMFDLKRTGRAVELLKNSSKNNTGLMNGLTENNLTWPIPETVVDQNPGLWKSLQNPGY